MMVDKWIYFENDKCEACGDPKVAKLAASTSTDDRTLKVIVSCNCDTCVFGDDWKESAANGDLFIVIDPDGVNNMIRMIADHLGAKK